MFGGDDDDDDAKILELAKNPLVTATIQLASPKEVEDFAKTLAEDKLDIFTKIVAEPLGAYCLGAFMEGKQDIFTEQADDPKLPGDFGQNCTKTVMAAYSADLARQKAAATAFAEWRGTKGYQQFLTLKVHSHTAAVNLESFELLRPLGRGAFGLVEAVRKKDTGAIYAMKKMVKKTIFEKGACRTVTNERKILAMMYRAKFALGLAYAFQNYAQGFNPHLMGQACWTANGPGAMANLTDVRDGQAGGACFLVVPILLGGTLEYHLEHGNVTPAMAPFYGAQICLGLLEMHGHKVLHRDIKPENLMLDLKGNVCLIDFGVGLIRRGNSANKSKVGTHGYWAPEVIKGTGAGSRADSFSMGVVLYELLSGGKNPFMELARSTGKDIDECTQNEEPDYEGFDDTAKDLLRGMLQKKPKARFTLEKVKNHLFFKGVDWVGIESQTTTAPFVPESDRLYTKASEDVGDFADDGKQFAWDAKSGEAKKKGFTEEDQKRFERFDYVDTEAVQREIVDALSHGSLKVMHSKDAAETLSPSQKNRIASGRIESGQMNLMKMKGKQRRGRSKSSTSGSRGVSASSQSPAEKDVEVKHSFGTLLLASKKDVKAYEAARAKERKKNKLAKKAAVKKKKLRTMEGDEDGMPKSKGCTVM